MSEIAYDVLVVGAGPAGIAAGAAAAESGARVCVLDDNPAPGGQIWRGAVTKDAAPWIERLRLSGAHRMQQTCVIDRPRDGRLLVDSNGRPAVIAYNKLILATGARERFLPFPGWTLPNVMGAGGLQAMVKGGLPVEDKRVVVAGSGPLLLAVAAYLRQRGAQVLMIAEQASWANVRRFALSLIHQPAKLLDAARLKLALLGVTHHYHCHPRAAEGDGKLERVLLDARGKEIRVECDYLACGFGLVPNLELPWLLGCEIRRGFVAVNEWQETSVRDVWCAGEPVGIGGLALALASGEIAGLAAAGRRQRARQFFSARDKALRFQVAMEEAFALRNELKTIATPETIVCRCEDVTLDRITRHASWRAAKLATRCGMGPCQGRVCGPALEFLTGLQMDSVRAPIFPVPLGAFLTGEAEQS